MHVVCSSILDDDANDNIYTTEIDADAAESTDDAKSVAAPVIRLGTLLRFAVSFITITTTAACGITLTVYFERRAG